MFRRRLSVVVVDGAALALRELAARVRAQKVGAQVELIFVARGGRSASASLADTVVPVGKKATTAECWNAGLRAARGEVVVLLHPEALPADPRWLFHLCADASADAVFAPQLPGGQESFACVALSPQTRFDAHDDGSAWVKGKRTNTASGAAVYFRPKPARRRLGLAAVRAALTA